MATLRQALDVFAAKFKREPEETTHYGLKDGPWVIPETPQRFHSGGIVSPRTETLAPLNREYVLPFVTGPSTGRCGAYQASDQMTCRCGLTWDVNDTDPPICAETGERPGG